MRETLFKRPKRWTKYCKHSIIHSVCCILSVISWYLISDVKILVVLLNVVIWWSSVSRNLTITADVIVLASDRRISLTQSFWLYVLYEFKFSMADSFGFKVTEVGTNRKPVCDFLLVTNSLILTDILFRTVSKYRRLLFEFWTKTNHCVFEPPPLGGGA